MPVNYLVVLLKRPNANSISDSLPLGRILEVNKQPNSIIEEHVVGYCDINALH